MEKPVELFVAGWAETSLVDVLGEVSFTIWFCGCDFRCPWCQNKSVVLGTACREVGLPEVLEAISGASLLSDYVQATGGEPALQPEGLRALFKACKEVGMKTSLDTNGSREGVVRGLLEAGLVDHLAMDVKAPLSDPAKYGRVSGLRTDVAERMVRSVRASLEKALEMAPFLEVRTTFVPTLHEKADLVEIAGELVEMGLADRERAYYVIQQFSPRGDLMDPSFANVRQPLADELLELARQVKEATGLKAVYVRTQERGVIRA